MTALVASRGQTECHQLIQQLRHRAQAILDARRDATPETLRAALASSERHAARCEADLERLRGDFAQLEPELFRGLSEAFHQRLAEVGLALEEPSHHRELPLAHRGVEDRVT